MDLFTQERNNSPVMRAEFSMVTYCQRQGEFGLLLFIYPPAGQIQVEEERPGNR